MACSADRGRSEISGLMRVAIPRATNRAWATIQVAATSLAGLMVDGLKVLGAAVEMG